MSADSLRQAIEKVLDEGKLTPRGVIPVDLFGRSANYREILPIAEQYGLFVLEDAAQGFGGSLDGKRNGSFGDASATSFFPAKPLGCYGDGGAIFTDDEKLYSLMASIRVHGQGSDKYDNVRMGINGRMDTMQAAVILAKLPYFEEELRLRQKVARRYREELSGYYELPRMEEGFFSAWAQFTLKARDEAHRARIIEALKAKDIPIMIYYPIPLHMQTAFAYLGYKAEDLPVCARVAKQVFSVPMHPYLEEKDIERVCDALKELASK